MDDEIEPVKDEESDIFFGDKFARWFIAALAGFVVEQLVELAYDKYIVERRDKDDS
jgi:hypothetical protein